MVRPDILECFPELFARQRANGREIDVLGTIATLSRELEPELEAVLSARRKLLDSPAKVAEKYAWPDWEDVFQDPVTGRSFTYRQIVGGLVDNFLGRESPWRWRLNDEIPIPVHVHPSRNPGLELTGPWHPLDMAFNALSSPAPMNMPDFEDASPPHFTPEGRPVSEPLGVFAAMRNAKDIFEGRWAGRAHEVVKKGRARVYRLERSPELWPTRLARPPGLHVRYDHVTVDGRPAPGMVVVATLWVLLNHDALFREGSGVYFYIPKLQTAAEALWVERLLSRLEGIVGVAVGTYKVKMLYEEGTAGRQLPAIVFTLRRRLLGTNVGRWDYLGSLIEMWKDDPRGIFPDPQTLGMATPGMIAYQRYNALLMLMAGMKEGRLENAAPIGGMAAVMIYQAQDPYGRARYNPLALRAMVLDKLRERLLGLFFVPEGPLKEGARPTLEDVLSGRVSGTLYDAYRQSWVASPEAEYVAAGNAPLQARVSELQGLVDAPRQTASVKGTPVPTVKSGLSDGERALLCSRGLLNDEGRITPLVLGREALDAPEKLLTRRLWEEIYGVPRGEVTIEHVQHALYMAANYGFQILNGNFAAAIDDYELKLRFMNDLATYRINVSWLWTLFRHQAQVTRDGHLMLPVVTEDGVVLGQEGEPVAAGTRLGPALREKVLEHHDRWTAAFFAEQDRRGEPARFDRSKAPVIMEILRRQLTSPRYLQHSARVLFVLGEASSKERGPLLAAIFDLARGEVVRRVSTGELPRAALLAHDYVLDVFAQG